MAHPDVPIPRAGHWPCQTDTSEVEDLPPRLVAFLYRLMRNDLPTGAVEEHLIQTISLLDGDGEGGEPIHTDFTNGHLEELARSHAAFLLGKGRPGVPVGVSQ